MEFKVSLLSLIKIKNMKKNEAKQDKNSPVLKLKTLQTKYVV